MISDTLPLLIALESSLEEIVDKAPAEVIEKERAKLAEAEQALGKLAEQHARIASL